MGSLIAETTDIQLAIEKEQALPPGLYEVRLHIITPLSQQELNDLHDYFLDHGVDVKGCLQQRLKGLYQVVIQYEKHPPTEGIAWAAALIAILPVILITSLIGIGLFKIESLSKAIMPILLVCGGFVVVALALARKPLERFAEHKYG